VTYPPSFLDEATNEERAANFVETAYRTFLRAGEVSGGIVERYFRIGPKIVRTRFAQTLRVSHFTEALEHLACSPCTDPALTVCFFDSESTGTLMPPPPWQWDAYGRQGTIAGYNTRRVHTVYAPHLESINTIDVDRALAIYWTRSLDSIPSWERSFPLRSIFHWWTQETPLQPIHAGAVGFPEGGVLITGKSGSGKTTTTLSCLDSDLLYAGDDYVLIQAEPEAWVYSLYNTAKLEPHNLVRFRHLERHISNTNRLPDEKAVLYLNQTFSHKLTDGFPIRAIVIPRVTNLQDSRLVPARPSAALMAIAPTTTFQLPAGSEQVFRKLSALVRTVPTFVLEAGTDLPQIPQLISKLLKTVGQQ
jgi:hypothetical protein